MWSPNVRGLQRVQHLEQGRLVQGYRVAVVAGERAGRPQAPAASCIAVSAGLDHCAIVPAALIVEGGEAPVDAVITV